MYWTVTVCLIALIFLIAGIHRVHSRDLDGKYAQSPLKPWFDSLKSKSGVPCCDTTDGLRLEDVDWDTDQPNRLGPAIVWPFKNQAGKIEIRCFIAGALT